MEQIRVSGSKVIIDEFQCGRGRVEAQEVDLTPYQGQVVRIYLDDDLRIRVNPQENMYWQLAEVILPPQQYRLEQQGTEQVTHTESVIIVRGGTDIDAVPNIDGREIFKVGYDWQNYRKGVEWQANNIGVHWIGERSPQSGVEYPVELRSVTEEPRMASVVEPLELDDVNIYIFDLPE